MTDFPNGKLNASHRTTPPRDPDKPDLWSDDDADDPQWLKDFTADVHDMYVAGPQAAREAEAARKRGGFLARVRRAMRQ